MFLKAMSIIMNTVIVVSILTLIGILRSKSQKKLEEWREQSKRKNTSK